MGRIYKSKSICRYESYGKRKASVIGTIDEEDTSSSDSEDYDTYETFPAPAFMAPILSGYEYQRAQFKTSFDQIEFEKYLVNYGINPKF